MAMSNEQIVRLIKYKAAEELELIELASDALEENVSDDEINTATWVVGKNLRTVKEHAFYLGFVISDALRRADGLVILDYDDALHFLSLIGENAQSGIQVIETIERSNQYRKPLSRYLKMYCKDIVTYIDRVKRELSV